MRAVVQRVYEARVRVGLKKFGSINRGLLVYLGVGESDREEDLNWTVKKIIQVRIFEDTKGKMNRSVLDIGGDILLISQFTLYGNLRKGSRPSFNKAAAPEKATAFYEEAIKRLSFALGRPVETGRFGEHMEIYSEQDGPVTLILDSHDKSF